MLNDIIAGISVKLHETFDSECKIYKENVPQGFKEPCFVISHIRTTSIPRLPNRYLRRNSFDIQYFPKEGCNKKSELYEVAEQLLLSLEYIFVLDNLCRGTKMSPEIVDDVLHFFVSYDMFVKKDSGEPQIHMNELTSNTQTEV